MSKFVKELEIEHLRRQFDGVEDVLVVNVIGMDATGTTKLRQELRKKGIRLQVVKNSLAGRVFGERGLAGLSAHLAGTSAIAWGGEGIVELAREIAEWSKKIEKFQVKGGAVSGQILDAKGVQELSKLPSRIELLGRVARLIQSPGSRLVAQILGPGGLVASQVKQVAEKEEQSAPAA